MYKKHYNYHIDSHGLHYIGLTLDWNYQQDFVDISMSGYISKLLKRLNPPSPLKPTYSPHEYCPVI